MYWKWLWRGANIPNNKLYFESLTLDGVDFCLHFSLFTLFLKSFCYGVQPYENSLDSPSSALSLSVALGMGEPTCAHLYPDHKCARNGADSTSALPASFSPLGTTPTSSNKWDQVGKAPEVYQKWKECQSRQVKHT